MSIIVLTNKELNNLPINNDIQVIITSNDTVGINKKLLENAKIFRVEQGTIIEKGDYNGRK